MDALTGLFDKVGLRTNANKTMGMVCNTCKTARRKLEEPYTRMMTGVGTSFQEQQRKRVSLPECTVVLASGLLAAQCQYQHGMSKSPKWDPPPPQYPRLYRVSFPWVDRYVEFPVVGCGGRASTRTNLWIQLVQCHIKDTIMILKEGNHPQPCCTVCDMFMPWEAMNHCHPTTAI